MGDLIQKTAEGVIVTLIFLAWIAGTVLAPGLAKLAAVLFPPYAWYLVVEKAMTSWGWV